MKKIHIALLLAAALLFTSCLDDVEFDPTNRYTSSLGFKNRENVELYLNSFYPIVYNYGQFGPYALGNNYSMSDGLTDILKYGGIVAGTGDCNLIMTVDGQQSVSANYFDTWTLGYGWVRRLNEFLQGLEENRGNFTAAEYERFRAEALFYRAYVYFLMMRSHASAKDDLGVILYTDLSQMTPANKNRARSDIASSYQRIHEDAAYAATYLPEPKDARGRLHRYAACALQARAMLYAGRYTDAAAAVHQIETSQLYDYADDYAAIFTGADKSETIWSFEFQTQQLTHLFDARYGLPGDIASSGGYAGPTQEFVDMFDYADGRPFEVADRDNRYITDENVGRRDPRLASSVLYNGAAWKERRVACYEGGVDQKYMPYGSVNSPGNSVTGYYMRKMLDETNLDYVAYGSSQPWIEFRYAEMMLIKAECQAAGGDYSGARETVAALRSKRFGREDVYTAPATSRETALDLVLKERAVELCYEGHRFWDLRRTGRARQVLHGKSYHGVMWHPQPDGSYTPEEISCEMGARRYPERFDRFPIPQSEVSNNTLLQQNSDW